MRLNIETQDVERTLEDLRICFLNQTVNLLKVYEKTADFEIKPKPDSKPGEYLYTAESLLELSYDIPAFKIRIY